MMKEQLVAMAIALLAMAGFWKLVPSCPECGSLISVRDSMDPSLRHCRRCLSIFHRRERR
jgi:hypothetical protein